MHQKQAGGRDSPVAKRLRLLRIAEGGDNSTVWSRRVGMTLPQLSNYENGVMLSRDAAIRLATRVPGLTTDWLWLGREEGLSVDLRRRLQDAAKAMESAEASQGTQPSAERSQPSRRR